MFLIASREGDTILLPERVGLTDDDILVSDDESAIAILHHHIIVEL